MESDCYIRFSTRTKNLARDLIDQTIRNNDNNFLLVLSSKHMKGNRTDFNLVDH